MFPQRIYQTLKYKETDYQIFTFIIFYDILTPFHFGAGCKKALFDKHF